MYLLSTVCMYVHVVQTYMYNTPSPKYRYAIYAIFVHFVYLTSICSVRLVQNTMTYKRYISFKTKNKKQKGVSVSKSVVLFYTIATAKYLLSRALDFSVQIVSVNQLSCSMHCI